MALKLTMIGRANDGLPLAASVQSEEQRTNEYQTQGKLFFKKLRNNSPPEGTLETKNNMVFHYIIRNGVCYLCLCDKSFPKKIVFSYLDDLNSEFFVQYGARIDSITRPYAFIEFDSYIQKAKRSYSDQRNSRNVHLEKVSTELQGVQKIMLGNIDDVLKRGKALDELARNSSTLDQYAGKYRKEAKQLNNMSLYVKVAAGGGVMCLLFLIFRFFIF